MVDSAKPDKISVLDFMAVRSPEVVDPVTQRQAYIFDEHLASTQVDDLASSRVGGIVWNKIFCGPAGTMTQRLEDLRAALLWMLTQKQVVCGSEALSSGTGALEPGDLERQAYLLLNGIYYLLPERLGEGITNVPLLVMLLDALPILASYRGQPDISGLKTELETLIKGTSLADFLFPSGKPSDALVKLRRALFDALYLLYVFRRWTSVNFEEIIKGLRGLHTIEGVALGQVVTALDLNTFLLATPVVHPMFARLFWYAKPFNDLKPLGIGDLKVVKQWLIEYIPGEISDIHNVMKGEVKKRSHRLLEKTEQTFSFTSETQQETTRDTQSTDRFEVKSEAEQVVKSDFNVNANVRAQYSGVAVVVTANAGFAYNHSDSNTMKTAQNFSHEVINKAVSRVQTRVVQQRTVTMLQESEEINKHSFTAGSEHISGIYRWVDKRYKAQLYNYGKRMMFEFTVPEPAAFLVESRLRAFEGTLDVPQPPAPPAFDVVNLGFLPSDIDEARFATLRTQYDLSAFSFPSRKRSVALMNQETGQAFFKERDVQDEYLWYSKTYDCKLDAKGYEIASVNMDGSLYWWHSNQNPNWRQRNFFSIAFDGTVIHQYDKSTTDYTALYIPNDDLKPDSGPYLITGDTVHLTLGFQNILQYELEMLADLTLSAGALLDWQIPVYDAVLAIEQRRVDDANRAKQLAYDTAMVDFQNRIGQLRATAINDLLQGGSEATNRDVIFTELKKASLAVIAKEFDADKAGDLLTDLETMKGRDVDMDVTRLTVNEPATGPTTVTFKTTTEAVQYPSVMLDAAREKGRYIQFLEQAFEWDQLAYICYPYFWAIPPKWVQMLARTSDADPFLAAFLRAGYAKVVVAVAPEYDEAVLHFLATREPWEGGPAPVLGDPLYIPIYEELRNQHDDRFNAVPEGDPWTFTVPTSLIYLEGSTTPLPILPDDPPP
jgi:hypothetical protein